ncbi:DNA protecting protein DprA [Candidatus Omnitrophus magneticus]|uniref:DNA protecting protein DprA n=1 Tax=Candidatus Omnitrophus magneticus TaxID=1609969 RepID=A0A0F0CLG6_9BACT|nr:DNA protecting protein DprA [Candidatus Omnitrophus magneticus]
MGYARCVMPDKISESSRELIALLMVPGLGPKKIVSLLEKNDSTNFCKDSNLKEDLFATENINYEILRIKKSKEYLDELEYIEKSGIKVKSYKDDGYPPLLKNIYDFPPVIFVKGILKDEDSNAIAVIGSRKCSFYGRETAERFSFELASMGVTIVSGMASGIDMVAHRGALKSGGRTIAVIGSGFKNIYPKEAEKIIDKVLENGAVITEFLSSEQPLARNFPRRNRIISGISKGVLVIEAALKSGSLITSNFALEQGREVFAVPGKIDSFTSAGTNELIKNGAKMVTRVEDIIEELDLGINEEKKIDKICDKESSMVYCLTVEEKKVLSVINKTGIEIEEIIFKTGISNREICGILLGLELKKIVVLSPGGKYRKI